MSEPFPQKLPRLWFTQNIRYFVYFLRELTGVFIALYVMTFIFLEWKAPHLMYGIFFRTITWIGFIAALFHTLTWFWVTMKLLPFRLSPLLKKFIYGFFVILWLFISLFIILPLFYAIP